MTDDVGGVLTVTSAGMSSMFFVAAEGMGPASGGPGSGMTLNTFSMSDLTVTYDLEVDDPVAPCTVNEANMHLFLNTNGSGNSSYANKPTTIAEGLFGRTVTSSGRGSGGSTYLVSGGWNLQCGEGDVAAGDGWTATSNGMFFSTSNNSSSAHWNVTRTSGGGLPADFSGNAGFTITSGGGGFSGGGDSVVIKAKGGDYAGGNGWKASVDWGGSGTTGGNSSVSIDYEANFVTNAEGKVETTPTTEDFSITADSNSGGGRYYNSSYNSKSDVTSTSSGDGWTYTSHSDSTYDESVGTSSNSNFGFELRLGTSTALVDVTFDGNSNDEWHIFDESNSDWTDTYDDGYGTVEVYEGKSTSRYTLDDVYNSDYDGNPSVSLGAEGATESGSVNFNEDYTFDQVSLSEGEDRYERTYTGGYEDYEGSGSYTWNEWELSENEYRYTETDHYEASSGDESSGGPSDEGWTEYDQFDESCYSWDHNDSSGYSDTGGPDCSSSSWFEHEDWPSYVDEALAMMEEEAAMEAGMEGTSESDAEGTTEYEPHALRSEEHEESDAGSESGNPAGIEDVPDTFLGQYLVVVWAFHEPPMDTYKSIGVSIKGIWQSVVGDPDATQTFQDALDLQPSIGGQKQGQHVAAFVDGFTPFADPLDGVYDPTNQAIRATRLAGAATRELVLLYTSAGIASRVAGPARWATSTRLEQFMLAHLWPSALVNATKPGLSLVYGFASLANAGFKVGSFVDTIFEIRDLVFPEGMAE